MNQKQTATASPSSLPIGRSPLPVGTRCSVLFEAGSFDGVVVQANDDTTFDVLFDADGERVTVSPGIHRYATSKKAHKRKSPEPAASTASLASAKTPKAAELSFVSPAAATAASRSPVATPAASPAGDGEDDDNEEFEVEKIVKAGRGKNKNKFLVKWRGWPASDNTWETAANLKNNAVFEAFLLTRRA
jgi:hypothetical protein